MRKIFFLTLFLVFSLPLVLAITEGDAGTWGADRAISGNAVTITVDDSNSYGVFTIVETIPEGVTVIDNGRCTLLVDKLQCESDDDAHRVITYVTEGSGTVSGVISGRGIDSLSFETRKITGDVDIPSETTPVCGNGLVEGSEVCDGTNFGGLVCKDYDFEYGTLSCKKCSEIDTDGCTNVPPGAADPRQDFLDQMGAYYDEATEEGNDLVIGWTLELITDIADLLRNIFP